MQIVFTGRGKVMTAFQNKNKQNASIAVCDNVSGKSEKPNNIHLIIGALVFSLAVVLGIMVYNYYRTYQNVRNDVIELSKNSSAQNAESIELFFTRHEDMLLTTAEVLEYTLSNNADDIDEVQTLLHNMSVAYNENIYRPSFGKEFTGIYAAVDGVLVHGLMTPDDLPDGYDPTERQWYSEGKAGGGSVVFGEPYYDIYDPSVLVMSATKLLSDGQTVVGMDITLEDMQAAGGNMDVSVTLNGTKHDYGHGLILTGQGIVMAHWDEAEQGKNYSDRSSPRYDFFRKAKECADSGLEYLEADVDGTLYGIFPYKLNNGWYVVALTDLEDIKTTLSDFSSFLLIGTLFVVLLVLIYCYLISRAYINAERLSENLQGALDLATTDGLTGYRNRTAFDIRVRELQEKIDTPDDASFVYIVMDLNDLKYVNDKISHADGDKYIRNSCNLVRSIIPSDIYRIGGDEFAMFLTDELFTNWELLSDRLRQVVVDANLALIPNVDTPSIAIGFAIHTKGENDDIDLLFRKADAEMYTDKATIKQARLEHSENGYTQDLKRRVLDKQLLASEMQKGLEEEQFEVWFQPQVNHANNGALIGAEALVRWRHPEKGMISPAVFIPLFEYNGLIYELDKYVWRHACKCMRRWVNDGMAPIPVSVNVSRLDMTQPDFMESIIAIAEEYRIPHKYINLEVTESAFSDDTGKIVDIVNELINRGFTIAIDDFGNGYSSLSLLRNVPAHIVKLDMQFFADGKNQSRNECIVESVIRMCKMLGMAVLAEGVECKEQADLLRTLGCTYIQGYLYSKPLPYADFMKYVQTTVSERLEQHNSKTDSERGVELAQSQRLFHSIISGTNDAIIVADSSTKNLLYANRAAEEYFGKRFDPLHPTTCTKYCEKGELCDNCPANDMKPGERREFVFSENGCHIKSLYAQMDWNGHNAFVFYQTDISAEIKKMEFANSLMDNLGVGIVIFRGDTPDELTPVFCNKEYMQLSGLRLEGFQTAVTKEHMYGVHPDDIAEARSRFGEAFRTGQSMRCRMRVKKENKSYEWVSMHANVKKLAEGGFELYAIFWDAEAESKPLAIDAERYKNYILWTMEQAKDSLSTLHLNVSKDICNSIHRSISINRPVTFENGISGFISSVVGNIADDAIRCEFAEKFSRKSLLNYFERGIFADTMRLPIRLSDKRIIWCNQAVSISKNPETDDVEAIMTLVEADKDIRLDAFYKSIVLCDYELVGSIDTKTGFVTVIHEPVSHGLPDLYGSAVHYMENLPARMKVLIDDAYVEAVINAISFDTILKMLEEQKYYICTFPAKQSLMGENSAFRWRFGYVDGSKTDILFTRRALL